MERADRAEIRERIVCAAIHCDDPDVCIVHKPFNVERGFVVCGLRHCHCFGVLGAMYPNRDHIVEGVCTDGFLTTKNRFVDRVEALEIALREGQVLDPLNIRGGKLYSEDLY